MSTSLLVICPWLKACMALVTGAPLEMSEDLMTTFNISLVVRGTISETSLDRKAESSSQQRYSAPKASNMFRQASDSADHLMCMPCVVFTGLDDKSKTHHGKMPNHCL